MVADALSPSLNPRLLVPGLAVLAGIGVAAGIATAPAATLDAVIGRSHLADVLPQAAAPIGVTGRSLIALAVGGLVAVLGFLVTLIPARQAPSRRRADAHPDAPPCRPLRPSEELDGALPIEWEEQPREATSPVAASAPATAPVGSAPEEAPRHPLRRTMFADQTPEPEPSAAAPEDVAAPLPMVSKEEPPVAPRLERHAALPIAPEPPVPPAVCDLPADLDQPLSAFDPDAIPASPLEPVRAVPPLTRVADVRVLPPVSSEPEPAPVPEAKIVAFALAPERCAADEEPRAIGTIDTGEETIGALVARLERVAREAARTRRERAARQPSLDDTLARLRQLAAG